MKGDIVSVGSSKPHVLISIIIQLGLETINNNNTDVRPHKILTILFLTLSHVKCQFLTQIIFTNV